MKKSIYTAFSPAQPYFDLVRGALGDFVDGDHFFDVVTDDTIYEVLYDLGWPRIIKGRNNLMAAFRGYCESISLQSAGNLITHIADNGSVVVIEYDVHGTILSSGVTYDNRFCSVITIANRKIAHWWDYMDSHAAWTAMTAPS